MRETANVTCCSVERGLTWSTPIAFKRSLWWILCSECPIIWRVCWIGGCVHLIDGRTRQVRKTVLARPWPSERKTRWGAAHSLPRKPLTTRIHPSWLVVKMTTVPVSGRAFRIPVLVQLSQMTETHDEHKTRLQTLVGTNPPEYQKHCVKVSR